MGGSPLRRLWWLAAPNPWRLALAGMLAFLALASAVGLPVVSAWLISRASQQPPILYLQLAIVAVRAFGIRRGVLRYAERLVGHDTALRTLTSVASTSGSSGCRRQDWGSTGAATCWPGWWATWTRRWT